MSESKQMVDLHHEDHQTDWEIVWEPSPAGRAAFQVGVLPLLYRIYHLVMTNIAMENHHFYQVNRYKWAISHGYVR